MKVLASFPTNLFVGLQKQLMAQIIIFLHIALLLSYGSNHCVYYSFILGADIIIKISILLIILLIAGCLSSCNKPLSSENSLFNTETKSPAIGKINTDGLKPDSYYTSSKQGVTIGKYLETPYGTYYCSFDGYLYYSEKGNTKYIRLSNKPDCSHNSEDCNSYIGTTPIGYYNGKIYY